MKQRSNESSPSFLKQSLTKALLVTGIIGGSLFYTLSAQAELDIKVYKNPSCGCCGNWVKHLKENGFNANVTATQNRRPIQLKMGVPLDRGACHTAVIDGYFIEGHVPAADIKRLLTEKPNIAGLTVPGMPVGSPGMESNKYPAMDYKVLAIDKAGATSIFAEHKGAR
jgi:hypothetical protein